MDLPKNYINHWLDAFEYSRKYNYLLITNFISEIEKNSSIELSQNAAERQNLHEIGNGWRASPDANLSWRALIKSILKERSYLLGYFNNMTPDSIWVIADDRRTANLSSWDDFEEQVGELGTGHAPKILSRDPSKSENMVFFSPNLTAKRKCKNRKEEKHINLSYISLFATPIAFPRNYLKALRDIIRSHSFKNFRTKNAWISFILAAAICTLLLRQRPARVVMLTSNSFIIEMLRYLYLASGSEGTIIEVLHGIPTCEITEYHEKVLSVFPHNIKERMRFIPPVPNLSQAAFPKGAVVEDVVVNLQMNTKKLEGRILEITNICEHRREDIECKIVIALNGAGIVRKESYQNTGFFALERKIFDFLYKLADDEKIDVHLQYSIHPAHVKSGEARAIEKSFSYLGVEVLEDSLQTWLEADLMVSIFSSASWDAYALGCPVAICIRPADKLFSEELLQNFAFPKYNQTIFDVLKDQVCKLSKEKSSTFRSRLSKI